MADINGNRVYMIPGFTFSEMAGEDLEMFDVVTLTAQGLKKATAASSFIGVVRHDVPVNNPVTITQSGIMKVRAGGAIAVDDKVSAKIVNGVSVVVKAAEADAVVGKAVTSTDGANGTYVSVLLG